MESKRVRHTLEVGAVPSPGLMPAVPNRLINRFGLASQVTLEANGVQQVAERYTQRQAWGALLVTACIFNDFTVIRQAAGCFELHIAAQFGDVANRIADT